MSPYDPSTWGLGTWALHLFGLWYLTMFFRHYFRFRRLEVAAEAGGAEEVEAFNRALRGFPANGFAKMLGKRPIVPERRRRNHGT